MDRGVMNNLGILAEEDDEEDVIGRTDEDESDDMTDSDGDDEANEGLRRGEPNKFDGLCDGVMNAMALVHAALQDLLEMKDEMLRHSLPPTLLVQLAMVSGRVFRSVSDLGNPVGELVRLVRVYSTPWEEKSAALKKLHEDYESKQRQLNIAVRRLQLVDSHSKRVAKEKRIMNWEKLFSKMTTAKGHGRRWKFLIETIKQKAKLGLEHVQAYTQSMDDSSESESEDVVTEQAATVAAGDVDDGSETQASQAIEGTEGSREDNEEDEEDGPENEGRGDEREEIESRASAESANSDGVQFDDIPTVSVHIGPGDEIDIDRSSVRSASPKKVRFEENVSNVGYIRPPMKDTTTWTGQPDYDRILFIRIFCPEGLDELGTGIKCSLSYDGNMFKTPMLDGPEEEPCDEIEEIEERPSQSQRPQAARKSEDRSSNDVSQETESAKSKSKRYFEFEIPLPEEVLEGILLLGEKPSPEPENLRIAVHQGQFEEIIAMATIDFQDIKALSLETIWLPAPGGDDDIAIKSRSESISCASSLGGESLSDSMDIPIMMDDETTDTGLVSSTPRDEMLKTKDPLPFPLYPLHGGKTDSLHVPCGNVPLFLYWGKRSRPLTFNRQCGTLGIYDIVYDMTGYDMTMTTKEDLHKETEDKALSVIAITPDPEKPKAEAEDKSTNVEETVLKSEYDKLVDRHQEEMIYLQEEYEKRLQDLIQNLQSMQTENEQVSQLISQQSSQPRPLSQASRVSTTPGALTPITAKRSERSDPSFYESLPLPQTGQSLRTFSRDKSSTDVDRERSTVSQSTVSNRLKPMPPRSIKPAKNFRIGKPLPRWGENLPQDFFDRLRLWEEERRQHKQDLNEKTLKDIKDNLEKKLAGQHKLSKHEEQIYDALKDVSLPALFMPYKTGNIFNPRAHHYFHPTGSSDVRLTQPPSVFTLPPLPNSKLSVVNLFELSKNFRNRGPAWLVERYIQQQQPSQEDYPQTPAPTSAIAQVTTTSGQTPINEEAMATPSSQRSLQPEIES